MPNKQKLARMKHNAALLVLHRLDYDDIYCQCGEPWETGREAVADLSGSDLLAFTLCEEGWNGYGPVIFSACPCCSPVSDEAADSLWEAYKKLRKMPECDSPDELLEMMMV